jgi:hypothetical protein
MVHLERRRVGVDIAESVNEGVGVGVFCIYTHTLQEQRTTLGVVFIYTFSTCALGSCMAKLLFSAFVCGTTSIAVILLVFLIYRPGWKTLKAISAIIIGRPSRHAK